MEDNAEGSSRPPTQLSQTQREVLVGTLLGDGCLAKHGYYHRLHIKHSIAQLALAEYKHRVFKEFLSMRLHFFNQHLLGRDYPCVQFATRTSPIFSEWYARFYRERKKVIPHDIGDFLSPLALAVWVMDDGAADFAGVTLQTHNFCDREIELLKTVLIDELRLNVTSRANKGHTVLYVPASGLDRLRELTEPHVLPELRYKLVPRRERTP